MTEICRTCLQEVGDSSVVFYLDAVESQSETITIRCKLADCVPEMDLDVVPNAFICNSCFKSLIVAHEFKNKCLETEGRIQSYIEQMGYVLTSVDLRDIVQQNNETSDVKPLLAFMQPTKDSSHLYDTNKNSIAAVVKEEPKETSLDLKNLQCDTRAFFAVPKIAQLLAEGSSHKCSQCNYKASSDFDLKSHEETHLSQKHQKCDTRDFFTVPKIAKLLPNNGTSFKCSQCTYVACSDLDLKSHEEMHFNHQKCDTRDYFAAPIPKMTQLKDNGTLYSCSECTYIACSDLDLKSHEEVHFNHQKPQKCDTRIFYTAPKIAQLLAEPDLTCDTQDYFVAPKIAQLLAEGNGTYSSTEFNFDEMKHKCTECDYSAPKRQTLILHMRKHSGDYSTLVQHIRAQKGERPCDFTSVYSNALSKHIRKHTGDKPFKCELCNYRGRLKYDLKTHMRLHTTEKPYKCLLCDYASSHKTNLSYHMRIHTGEKPYRCKTCNYRTSQKTNLLIHVKAHTTEKLYKCNECNYSTVHSKSLSTHMHVHGGEKSYSCTFCNYSSSTKVNLMKHVMIHTGENLLQCFNCGYKTISKADLEQHMSAHTSCVCAVCQKMFGNVENLKIHMKQHTGGTEPASTVSEATMDFQINRDTNNCESAVKKEMII